MFYKIAFYFIPIIFIYNKKFRNILFCFNKNDNSYKNRNLKYSEYHAKHKKNGVNFIVKIIDYGYLDLLLLDYSDDINMLKYIFKCFDDYYFDFLLNSTTISIIYPNSVIKTNQIFRCFDNLKNKNIINFMKENNYFEKYHYNIYLYNDTIKLI
jgi:hypothetical protein